jgi:Uma2 family endonuclease
VLALAKTLAITVAVRNFRRFIFARILEYEISNDRKVKVMASTITPPLTLEEYAQLPSDGVRHEISEGELITMSGPKSLHTLVALAIFEPLQAYLKQHGAARALPQASYILSREPLTVRQADVSVLSKQRIESTAPDDYFEGAPELAVEVISPSDSAEDLEVKVDKYQHSGSKQVWVVYPNAKRIHIFKPDRQVRVLDETQTLEGGEFLPGFSMKIADLFSENHATA